MKFKKGLILASPTVMFEMLEHFTREPMFSVEIGETLFLFRSGARLIYLGGNQWSIHGYAADKSDVEAALTQLRAAEYMRLAAMQLKVLDDQMQTPMKFRRKFQGMDARYPDGSPSSTLKG